MLAAETLAGAAIRSQHVIDHKGRKIFDVRTEGHRDIGAGLIFAELASEGEGHRRVRQERLLHCRRKRQRRRAENHKTPCLRKIGRGFQNDMAAEAPADENSIAKPKMRDDVPQYARIARHVVSYRRIGGVI